MQEFVENYYSFEFTGNPVESDSDHKDENTKPVENEKPKEIPVVNSMEEKLEIVVVIDGDNDK